MIRILKLLIGLFKAPRPDTAGPVSAGRELSHMTRIGLLGAHIGQVRQAGGLRGKTR